MGTTESVLSEPHRHQDATTAAPIEARHHQPSQRRQRPLPNSTTIKPFLKHHGMLLGLPSSGKRTLLQRLEGKDPFSEPANPSSIIPDNNASVSNNNNNNKVVVPFQSTSTHWDRIQLHVEIPEQQINPDTDFAVVLVNPQHEPKSVRLYVTNVLSLLLQQPGPVALCVLINFRDQPKHSRIQPHDLQDALTELLRHHPERTDVVIQVERTSLLNCYGLNTLHHFIYRSYLIRKQAEWQEKVLQCQSLLNDAAVMPFIEYEEFMDLLHNHHPTPVQRRTTELPPTEERRTMGLIRTHNAMVSPPPILPIVRGDATKALEAFFADSDDDDDDERRKQTHAGPASLRTKVDHEHSDDSDDDDGGFFYDEGGQRNTAVQASGVPHPASEHETPTISTTRVDPVSVVDVKKPPSPIQDLEAKEKSTKSTTRTTSTIQMPVNGKQAKEVVAPGKASGDATLPMEPIVIKSIEVTVKPDLRLEAVPNSDSTLVKGKAKPMAVVAKAQVPPPPIVNDLSATIVPIKDESTTLPKVNGDNQSWSDEEDDDFIIEHKDKAPAQEDEDDVLPDSVTDCNPRPFSIDSISASRVDGNIEASTPPNTVPSSRFHQQDEGGCRDGDDEDDLLVDDDDETSVLASASVDLNTVQHDHEVLSEQEPVVTTKYSTSMSDESKRDDEQNNRLTKVIDALAADHPVEETQVFDGDSGNDALDTYRRTEPPAPMVDETSENPPQVDVDVDNVTSDDAPISDPSTPPDSQKSPTSSRERPAQVDNPKGNITAQVVASYLPTGPLTSCPTSANDSDDDEFFVEASTLPSTKPAAKNGNKNNDYDDDNGESDDNYNGESDDNFVVEVFSPLPSPPPPAAAASAPTGLSVAALAAIAAAQEQAQLMLVEADAEAAAEEKFKSEKKSKKKKSKEEKAMKKEKKKKSKKSKAVASTSLHADEGGSDSDW